MPVETPEDLYGLPLDQFIPERAALAKALKGEKRKDDAAQVTALRKPSVAAWAVNQLIRTQTASITALFTAGDDLAEAQAQAAAGQRAGDAMRDATRRQREAMSDLLQAAEGLLSSAGQALSQTTLERVGDTLRAAAIDPDARDQVKDGCLTHELKFAGLGIGALGDPSPTPAPAKPGTSKPKARPAKDLEAERKHRAALKAAQKTQTEARQAATRAEKELSAAHHKREEAAASLTEAERLLADALQRAEQAADELTTAEKAVEELS